MTKHKPTLAEIFHMAADKCLAPSRSSLMYSNKQKYSCSAIVDATMRMSGESQGRPITYAALKFAKECGVKTGSPTQFSKFKDGDVQSVRYAWLKLLAQVAEEEGL